MYQCLFDHAINVSGDQCCFGPH